MLINHGGTEMGQGLHTKMIQVAATALGVPMQSVRLAPTRTDKVPNTSATAASSGADLNGGAVKDACEQIRGRLAAVAAGRLGVHPDEAALHLHMQATRQIGSPTIPFGLCQECVVLDLNTSNLSVGFGSISYNLGNLRSPIKRFVCRRFSGSLLLGRFSLSN